MGDFAGISIGTVDFYPLGLEWATIDENNFEAACKQSAIAKLRPALNILIVPAFGGVYADFGVLGVTAWLPANALQSGTSLSGMAVTMSLDPVVDAQVIRHEMGHYAGLLHTTELQPSFYGDALADTPHCPDIASDPLVCPDVENLMFPFVGIGNSAKLISDMQASVIQGSAVYRGIVEEGGQPSGPFAVPHVPTSTNYLALDARAVLGVPRRSSWATAANLDARAERLLNGFYCPRTWQKGASPALYQVLQTFGRVTSKQLITIAMDRHAPIHVRTRAVTAAAHGKHEPWLIASLSALATDRTVSREVRLGAVAGLEHASASELDRIARLLVRDSDPVVASRASRLVARSTEAKKHP